MKKFTVKPKLTHSRRILIGNHNEEKEHVFLGRLAEAGQLVRVDFDLSLPHVVAIFGKRGSGKSYTLGSFLEGLCTQEKETTISAITKTRASLLFDTLGIFQWMDIPLSPSSTQEVLKDQVLFHRGWDIQSEPLDVQTWTPKGTTSSSRQYREFTINCADFTASDWGYLFGVDILQDRMGQLLNDAYEKVVNEGWSDGKSTYPPKSRYAIEDLMECVQNDTELLANYHSETRRAVLQQLSVYWRNPLFQPKRKIPAALKWLLEKGEVSEKELKAYESLEGTSLSSLLKPGQLSILLLHKMSDELRLVLIVSLIRKIMQARIETSEMEKNLRILPNLSDEERRELEEKVAQGIPPVWIVADEAQNFLPSERKTTTTDVLIRFVREGRNFGLSFMLTTQQPSAIDQRILAQVDTLIVHKLTVQGDIEYVRRNLKSALPEEVKYGNNTLSFDDLLRSLDIGQAIVSNTEADRTFIMDVRPRVSVHGGFGV
ncbi:MAG TPA: ATP-binding protein [Bacteroidales bacterium]|nr:ATP-binding protein [Bacteroidales bacterium]